MTLDTNPPVAFIGCDVGKASIVAFDSRDGHARTIANRPEDLAAFAAALDHTCLVICEATGGHEAALLNAVIQAGHAVHRADARKVKAFIRSFGILGKTDAIDARALSHYGSERHAKLARWKAPDPERERLQALVLTRCDLIAERLACKNRLAAPGAQTVKPYLDKLLECFDAQIEAIEADTQALIRAYQPLDRATKIMCSLIGVGFTTAAAVIGLMPELGTIDRRQAAALGGLAPHPRQSGAVDAYRRVKGGRPEIKRVLFMAALSAAKHNPELRAFYQRLLANGKKPLVALVALMRKLIVILNAMLRDGLVANGPVSDGPVAVA
jgi:transposase